jgi:hypothetical protein
MKIAFLLLIFCGYASALDTLKTKNVFANSDTISALKFNQNFDTIRTRVNRIVDTVNLRTNGAGKIKVDSVYARTIKMTGAVIIGAGTAIDSIKTTTGGGHDTLKMWLGSSLFKVTN